MASSTTSSPALDDVNPLAAINKASAPPPLPSSPPRKPHIVVTHPSPISEISDDALLSGQSPLAPSSLSSHPLQPGTPSSSSSSANGFASAHSHLHPPNLRLEGLSHVEPFYTFDGGVQSDGTRMTASTGSQPSSPMQPSSQSSSPTANSSFMASAFYAAATHTPLSNEQPTHPLANSPGPASSSHMTASPSIGTLAAATFAGIRADPAVASSAATPATHNSSTGYAGTMPPSVSGIGINGHINFFHPNNRQQPPLPSGPPPQYHPPQQMQQMHQQQQAQQQQQQQRPGTVAPGGAAAANQAGQNKASGGFFSKLFKKDESAAGRAPVERPPPLPIYMQRLRRTHDWHFNNIHALRDRRKKFVQRHNEEVAQWEAWALWPLAALAHQYYLRNIHHIDALLDMEAKYMNACIEHITVVNAVFEGKQSEQTIMRHMMSAAGDGKVKEQEEVDAMFWPPDAEEIRRLTNARYEETKRLEAQYTDMKNKLMRRDALDVRRRKLQDWLMRGLVHRDSLQVDTFHHHPLEPRVQHLFNNLMTDQRGDEGRIMRQFLDMQTKPEYKPRMTAPAILHFVNFMMGQILKTYTLDERTIPILRVYVDRLIFPRIPEALNALVTPEEREKGRELQAKLPWLRSLTPKQLGMDEDTIPPDYIHDTAYVPLLASTTTLPLQLSPLAEEKKQNDVPPAAAAVPAASSPPPGDPGAGGAPHSPPATPAVDLTSPHPPKADEDGAAGRRMVPDNFPYAEAINTLAQVNTDVVPFDIFFRVVSAVRLVHSSHKTYTRANREARARAQSRALTYDDPFTNFMTRLVEESSRNAEELERKDAEERERRLREAKEAELKKQADALAAQHKHSPQSASSAHTASPTPMALAPAAASTTPGKADGATAATAGAAAGAAAGADGASGASGGDGDHLSVPAPAGAAAANGAVAVPAPSTPQKSSVIDHPLAAHHLIPQEPLHFTSPSPVPSLPAPCPVIPERPQEETPLNADQLTPLCEWIVIHANVPSLPAKLDHVIRFVPGDWIRFGEAGYSFCQVESAVLYLEHLSRDSLGRLVRHGEEDGVDGHHGTAGGLPRPRAPSVVTITPPQQVVEDRVSSPAGTLASPSVNLLSPGDSANRTGPKHSQSMDDVLTRSGSERDAFSDLLSQPPNADPPRLPPLQPAAVAPDEHKQ